jgi:hypothetical protein
VVKQKDDAKVTLMVTNKIMPVLDPVVGHGV